MNLSIETLAKGKKELEELREIRATSLARVVTSIRQVSTISMIINCKKNSSKYCEVGVSQQI